MTSERLAMLLREQQHAKAERDYIAEMRDDLCTRSLMAGYDDLSQEDDVQFRLLTEAIAELDHEIEARVEEIEELAAWYGLRPITD